VLFPGGIAFAYALGWKTFDCGVPFGKGYKMRNVCIRDRLLFHFALRLFLIPLRRLLVDGAALAARNTRPIGCMSLRARNVG
jgi:hypothetical protein